MSNQVISQIKYSELTEVTDVFNLGDFIGVEVKNIQLSQILEISNTLNIVFTKHKHSEGWNCVQMWDFLDAVVVKVQENKCG